MESSLQGIGMLRGPPRFASGRNYWRMGIQEVCKRPMATKGNVVINRRFTIVTLEVVLLTLSSSLIFFLKNMCWMFSYLNTFFCICYTSKCNFQNKVSILISFNYIEITILKNSLYITLLLSLFNTLLQWWHLRSRTKDNLF